MVGNDTNVSKYINNYKIGIKNLNWDNRKDENVLFIKLERMILGTLKFEHVTSHKLTTTIKMS